MSDEKPLHFHNMKDMPSSHLLGTGTPAGFDGLSISGESTPPGRGVIPPGSGVTPPPPEHEASDS